MSLVDCLNSFMRELSLLAFTDLVQHFLIHNMDDVMSAHCGEVECLLREYEAYKGVSFIYTQDTYRDIIALYQKDNASPDSLVKMNDRLESTREFLDINASLERIGDLYMSALTDLTGCLTPASYKKAAELLTTFKDRVVSQYVNRQKLKTKAYDLVVSARGYMVDNQLPGWNEVADGKQNRIPVFLDDIGSGAKVVMQRYHGKEKMLPGFTEAPVENVIEAKDVTEEKVDEPDPDDKPKDEVKPAAPAIDIPSGITLGNGGQPAKERMADVQADKKEGQASLNKVIKSDDGGQTFRMSSSPNPFGGLNVNFPSRRGSSDDSTKQ